MLPLVLVSIAFVVVEVLYVRDFDRNLSNQQKESVR